MILIFLFYYIAKYLDGLYKKVLLKYGDKWEDYIKVVDDTDANVDAVYCRKRWEQSGKKGRPWTPDWEVYQPLPFPRYMFDEEVEFPKPDEVDNSNENVLNRRYAIFDKLQ